MNPVLYVLLVEDDLQACNEIENYIYSLEDIELVGITNNASRALQIVLDTTPDAIILDLELHYGSGSGLSLLQSLQTEMVDKRPYVVVTTNYHIPNHFINSQIQSIRAPPFASFYFRIGV